MDNLDTNRVRNLENQKEKIKQFIEINGPSLPVHISSYLKLDSTIAGAFLSDLLSEKELKISNMRVGNSPLYYLRGQEFQLEKFANHLPSKEREAFYLLKEHLVLNDKFMLPAIRVALRSIKDYSMPLEYNGELYWRFMKANEGLAIEMIEQGKANFKQLPEKQIINIMPAEKLEVIEINKPIVSSEIKTDKIIEPEVNDQLNIENIEESKEIEIKSELKKIRERKIRKAKIKEKPAFVLGILGVLEKDNYKVAENEKYKKKDYISVIESENKKYLCIGKEKKVITESDLMSALKSGQKLKLPVVFVSNGELNKKALEIIEYFKELILFKRVEIS